MPADFQHILARLYTEKKLREEFISDTENFFHHHQISETTAEQLKTISKEELNYFSRSLLNKRFDAAAHYFKGTHFLLGKETEKYFRDFASNLPPSGINKHLNDAILFLEWIQKKTFLSKQVLEMALYEKFLLNNTEKKIRFMRVSYNLPAIRSAIFSKREPDLRYSRRLLLFKKKKLIRNFSFL